MKGMRMSVIRMSGFTSCSMDSAISPSGASPASTKSVSSQGKLDRMPSRTTISSSTRKTLYMLLSSLLRRSFLGIYAGGRLRTGSFSVTVVPSPIRLSIHTPWGWL